LSTLSPRSKLSARDLGFLIFLTASVAVFWKPLQNLFTFSLAQDYATHIILIVPVSAGLIYLKRSDVFSLVRTAPLPGSVLFLAGTILWCFAARCASWPFLDLELSLITLAIVLIWISGFILFYGMHAFAMARFPLLFLLLLGTTSTNCAGKNHLFSASWIRGGRLRIAPASLGSGIQTGIHPAATHPRYRSCEAM
jgi:Transmembrane exosortase (Exosortase_EpsH)